MDVSSHIFSHLFYNKRSGQTHRYIHCQNSRESKTYLPMHKSQLKFMFWIFIGKYFHEYSCIRLDVIPAHSYNNRHVKTLQNEIEDSKDLATVRYNIYQKHHCSMKNSFSHESWESRRPCRRLVV